MTRPTPEKTKEMQYRKAIKEIWEKNFNQPKDELIKMSLTQQFMTIKTGEKETDIHISLFDDYFTATGEKQKTSRLVLIKKALEKLL